VIIADAQPPTSESNRLYRAYIHPPASEIDRLYRRRPSTNIGNQPWLSSTNFGNWPSFHRHPSANIGNWPWSSPTSIHQHRESTMIIINQLWELTVFSPTSVNQHRESTAIIATRKEPARRAQRASAKRATNRPKGAPKESAAGVNHRKSTVWSSSTTSIHPSIGKTATVPLAQTPAQRIPRHDRNSIRPIRVAHPSAQEMSDKTQKWLAIHLPHCAPVRHHRAPAMLFHNHRAQAMLFHNRARQPCYFTTTARKPILRSLIISPAALFFFSLPASRGWSPAARPPFALGPRRPIIG